jgi:hypothetical protein
MVFRQKETAILLDWPSSTAADEIYDPQPGNILSLRYAATEVKKHLNVEGSSSSFAESSALSRMTSGWSLKDPDGWPNFCLTKSQLTVMSRQTCGIWSM